MNPITSAYSSAHAAAAMLRGQVIYCALAATRGLIAVAGSDAPTFLQGQLTCDVRQVSAARSQLGALCSPKGRVITVCRVLHNQDTLYLALPPALLESVCQRLSKYVLRAQVTLHGNALQGIGIAGEAAATVLADIVGEALPSVSDAAIAAAALSVVRVRGAVPRFEIYGNASAIHALQTTLAARAQLVSAQTWDLLDILAGIPSICTATVEMFVPQMLNLDTLDAISWHKGCYTGQEIVARTQYLGTLKRRMYLGRVMSAQAPQAGAAVYAQLDGAQQEVGRVVTAAAHRDWGYALLAVLRVTEVGQPLHLAAAAALELLAGADRAAPDPHCQPDSAHAP